ncbi:MAG: hypothetical protein CVT95_11485 [Bacteroidetes bacterium HGW-Bacteroidetes-12]|nr:MAG: hypothetical protein CVT95_11485 [Bacteroidetes bacterium HGW-Bacteroidetes-12]
MELIKVQCTTPYKIYAQIGFSTNRQTFNKNIASAEKSPIFTSHKSYKNSLATIRKLENFYENK